MKIGAAVVLRKMEHERSQETKLIAFKDAIELVMVLPGRVAKDTRARFASVIERYLAGDLSLIQEVEANARSSDVVSKMARESLGIVTDEEVARKRKREELEVERLCLENSERKHAGVVNFMSAMQILDPEWRRDQRLVVQTKDLLANIALGGGAVRALAAPAQAAAPVQAQTSAQVQPESAAPALTIQALALELGFGRLSHGDSCAVGSHALRPFREKHRADPPKRLQFVDGAERQVQRLH